MGDSGRRVKWFFSTLENKSMSRAAEALQEILVRSSDVVQLDSSVLGELDRWLGDACEELGNSQNVAGFIETCNRIYQELFASRLLPNLIVVPDAFDGLTLPVTRQRCIGLILAAPSSDPRTKIGRGAERIFDLMDAAGCFPEVVVEGGINPSEKVTND